MALENSVGSLFKVSRRLPPIGVAETKIFRSKEAAQQQIDDWLNQ